MWRSPTVAGEDLNHSRHRVRPVHHARRSTHHLDTLHVVGGKVGEVVRPARRVLRHAVDQHLYIVAPPTANEQRGLAPVRARGHHARARNGSQGVGHGPDPLVPQLHPADHGHSDRQVGGGRWNPRRGHDDRVQLHRVGRALAGQGRRDDQERERTQGESHRASFRNRRGVIWGRPSNGAIDTGHANTRSTVSRVSTSRGAPAPAARPSDNSRTRSANRAARFT